jgi:rhamnulokinase
MATSVFAAVDVGASGGRVMAGAVSRDAITLEPVHRFGNGTATRDGHLRWDITELFREIQVGLRQLRTARSIGIDTWGCDYGLIDADGRLLADPISYRDDRTTPVISRVHELIPQERLYATTGLQFLPFTTLYQLVAEQRAPLWPRAKHAVLLPDLIAYWLTGKLFTEVTNASTTGLLDATTHEWSAGLLDRLGIPADLLPPLQAPGETRGQTEAGTPVVTVGSHDTASAVVGVPATTPKFAYVVCGTWALVGVELEKPVISDGARIANFTNETGVDGRTRFLRNVGGLWLLQQCMREWRRGDLEALLAAASQLPPGGPRINVDDPSFIPPGNMPHRISYAAGRRTMTEAETVRCVLDSLAAAFARTVHDAVRLSGAAVDVVHMVGGGSQNALLCQLTADAVQLPVIAGPVEATALGNVVVQARAAGALSGSLEAIRSRIAGSTPLLTYEPA